MSNLPITSGTPQTAAVSAKTANNGVNSDSGDMHNSHPFGEVLARQLKVPSLKEVKLDKLADNASAQPVTTVDSKQDAVASIMPVDAGAIQAGMMAALLPQALNPVVATSASTDSDTATGVATKADAAAEIGNFRSTAVQPRESAAVPSVSVECTPFVMETTNVARDVATAAAAAQPLTGTLVAAQNPVVHFTLPVAQTVPTTINAAVGQNKWGEEFAQKITWLVTAGRDQTAELHLNPPQLGPLDVVLKINGDHATAQFTSPHAAVREAIEQALPRLREMLADNGIALGNATVGDQAARDSAAESARHTLQKNNATSGDAAASAEPTVQVSPISRHNGIVDTFA